MRFLPIITVAVAASAITAGAAAQQRRDIYADPENLKVLPKDISSADLRNTMRGFALGLGIRCTHCHAGEEGQSLLELDFAADDKDPKRMARGMLEMVATINSKVGELTSEADHEAVAVRCVTCHRGQNRPKLITDVLSEVLMGDGGSADAVTAKYRELRDSHFGSGVYDFSEFTLSDFADKLLKQDQREAAFAVLELNREYHPDSAMIYVYLGGAHQFVGETEPAIENYRKALELNPDFKFVEQRLKALEEAAGQP